MSARCLQVAAELWVVTVGFFAATFILSFYEVVFLMAGSVCFALAVQITLLFYLTSELAMPLPLASCNLVQRYSRFLLNHILN